MIDTVIIEPVKRSREDHSQYGYRVFLDGNNVSPFVNHLIIEMEPNALPQLTLTIPFRRCAMKGPIGLQFEEDDSE